MSRFIATDFHGVVQHPTTFAFIVSFPLPDGRQFSVSFNDLWKPPHIQIASHGA